MSNTVSSSYPHPTWVNRRKFLATLAGAGVALMLKPRTARADDGLDPRVAGIVASTIGIDSHNHIDVPQTASELPGPDIDLAGEMKKSGLSAIAMTFAVDYQPIVKPGDGYDRFIIALNCMDKQLERNGMKRSLNMADLKDAHQKGQPTVVQSVEGGHFLDGHPERVEEAYKRGLRHLGLLHDHDASVPLGDIYTTPPHLGGLTAFGAAVIKECNRLGILVDLAHADTVTVAAALKITTKPVIVSHTGIDWSLGGDPFAARMMKPRLISKEEAKIIADAGGVIGVWTHLADNPLEYAKDLRSLVDVIGIDHVCIGTDTKLTPPFGRHFGPRPGPNDKPGGDSNGHDSGPPKGPGAPQDNGPGPGGPGPGGPQNFGPGPGGPGGANGPGPHDGMFHHAQTGGRTNQAWPDMKAGFYFTVVDAMLKVGFTPDEIGKIGSGNYCRIFDAATSGQA